MATTRSKNKLPFVLGAVVIIVIAVYVYQQRSAHQFNDQITANCQSKKYYEIPLISLIGLDSSRIKEAIVEVRRNGQSVKTELGLKKTVNKDQSVDLDLYSISSEHTLVQKQDTILISIGREIHRIAGFTSNTIQVDHNVLLCQESYQLDGKFFNSDRPNLIGSNAKPGL